MGMRSSTVTRRARITRRPRAHGRHTPKLGWPRNRPGSGAVITHEYVAMLEQRRGTRIDVQVQVEDYDRLRQARLHEPAARRIQSCHDFDLIALGPSSLSANACKLGQADVGSIEELRHVEKRRAAYL
jgi:hypothetical protein